MPTHNADEDDPCLINEATATIMQRATLRTTATRSIVNALVTLPVLVLVPFLCVTSILATVQLHGLRRGLAMVYLVGMLTPILLTYLIRPLLGRAAPWQTRHTRPHGHPRGAPRGQPRLALLMVLATSSTLHRAAMMPLIGLCSLYLTSTDLPHWWALPVSALAWAALDISVQLTHSARTALHRVRRLRP